MSELRPRTNRSKSALHSTRHGRLKRSRPLATLAKILAATLGVLLVSGASVAAIAAWDVSNTLKPSVNLVDGHGKPIPEVGAISGAVNILLAGTDTRSGQGDGYGSTDDSSGAGLNDVTMLLHISADHKAATVVSFPRDMFVPIPSCPNPDGGSYDAMSSQKINTTLTYGGLPCTVLTVEQLTGLTIPYAAEIEFNGVVEMSNAVGGVPVCLAGPIDDPYTSLDLSAGEHTLKGNEALEFLRTRHGVGDGSDLGRISNQQVFLSSLVRTIKSSDVLGNPLKVYGLAKAAASNMTLSSNLNNPTTIASIGVAMKNINLNNVVFVQYPTYYVDDGVAPSTDDANALFDALSKDAPISLSGDTGVGSEADPNAPATAPPVPSAPPASDSASGSDTASGSSSDGSTPAPGSTGAPGTTVLPSDVHGQTAGQYTCSKPFSD